MINRKDAYWAWVWDLNGDEKERALVIDSAEESGWCVVVDEPERFLSGCEVYDTRNYINHYPTKMKRMPFGKFWDDGRRDVYYGYLDSTMPVTPAQARDFPYYRYGGGFWQHFEAGFPDEYKEVEE